MILEKTTFSKSLKEFQKQFYQEINAPVDAMWELLYIASSDTYSISTNSKTVGYCCIDKDKSLLQFFITKEYRYKIPEFIKTLILEKTILSAKLSTSSPWVFNACLNLAQSFKANTFCYQHTNIPFNNILPTPLVLATLNDIEDVKVFLKKNVGMDDTFGYTKNLVDRKELYLYKKGNKIIASQEFRVSDTQENIVDLGIIVDQHERGKGLGAKILQTQVNLALSKNKIPICSTTIDNKASQKIIERAGFFSSNIIFDLIF